MSRSSSGCQAATWPGSGHLQLLHMFLEDGTCPARGCALLLKSSYSPASPALWSGSFAEMNDLFPKWFLCDSCVHGGGKGFRGTPHDLRQLAQCKAGKCQHLPDGAGRKQAPVEPDGDAKSEGNELLLALGHFAPVSRGARPLCHSRAEDCFLCHL